MSALAADIVVLVHFGFILFVTAGGLLVLRWPKLAWLHLPCVAWGGAVEAMGWVCPLTPLELRLRLAGGQSGYTGDFIDRYLLPIIYPAGLTREVQVALGVALLLFNAGVYTVVWRRQRRSR